jgi:hypothetical protein
MFLLTYFFLIYYSISLFYFRDFLMFVGGALVLFTLFVFVEELMSCLRYLCL